jgi:hypothetical protein
MIFLLFLGTHLLVCSHAGQVLRGFFWTTNVSDMKTLPWQSLAVQP